MSIRGLGGRNSASENNRFQQASAVFWSAAVFAAVVPTIVGYGLYWWLLRRVGVTALNALLFLVAPATAAAGTVLFAEPLTMVTVAGFALCAAGVALVLVSEARAGSSTSPKASRTGGPEQTDSLRDPVASTQRT